MAEQKGCAFVAELVARCFAARTAAHLMHLQTRSYAQHMALGEFYDAIASAADTYVEAYQGLFGLVESYPDAKVDASDPVKMVSALRVWVVKNRKDAPQVSELNNQLDALIEVTDHTLYKLRFLA